MNKLGQGLTWSALPAYQEAEGTPELPKKDSNEERELPPPPQAPALLEPAPETPLPSSGKAQLLPLK